MPKPPGWKVQREPMAVEGKAIVTFDTAEHRDVVDTISHGDGRPRIRDDPLAGDEAPLSSRSGASPREHGGQVRDVRLDRRFAFALVFGRLPFTFSGNLP